jgi:hypothetical protein
MLNNKGNSGWKLFLLIIVILGIGFYYYYDDLFTSPTFSDKVELGECIGVDEINNFKKMETDSYSVYIPKEWELKNLNGQEIENRNSFAISENKYEFAFIWTKGYAFDADQLLNATISLLDHEVISEEATGSYNYEFNRKLVSFTSESGQMYQDNFGFLKDDVGYAFVLRTTENSYPLMSEDFEKVICSFKIK